MTRGTQSDHDHDHDDPTTTAAVAGRGRGRGGGTGMRIIVPLQGLVQGRGGLVLGSVIPCALFYFLQLYLKRNRGRPESPRSPPPQGAGLLRTASRMNMSPRGAAGRARVSARVSGVLRDSGEEEEERAGLDDGTVDMGLVQNTVRGFVDDLFVVYGVLLVFLYGLSDRFRSSLARLLLLLLSGGVLLAGILFLDEFCLYQELRIRSFVAVGTKAGLVVLMHL